MDLSILKDICYIPSPSNYEDKMVSYLKNLTIKNFKFYKSKKNSCTYSYDNGHPETVLIDAHIDTVHLRVIRYTKEGYIVARPIGFDSDVLDGNTVVHLNSGSKGSVITVAPHLNIKHKKKLNVLIDFGIPPTEISNIISIGDVLIFDIDYYVMNKKNIVGTGLDNKASVYVLIELLLFFDKHISTLKYNLILHFSSREETGMGSFANLRNKVIDKIFVLDTDIATDNELISSDLVGNIISNKGVVIPRNYEDDVLLGDELVHIAKKYKIPYQLSFSGDFGGTNASYYTTNFDAYTQFIGIVLKNMHSPNEIVSIKDLESAFELLLAYLSN